MQDIQKLSSKKFRSIIASEISESTSVKKTEQTAQDFLNNSEEE